MNALDGKYLQAAQTIGRLLVRDVCWADDQCYWLTQSEITKKFGTQPVVAACSRGLADGACGVGLFLARVFSLHDDSLTADVVAGVSHLLIGSLERSAAMPPSDRPSDDGEMAAALLEMTNLARLPLEQQSARRWITQLKLPVTTQPDSLSSAWRRRRDRDPSRGILYSRIQQFHAACRAGQTEASKPWSPADLAGEAIRQSESDPNRFACFADPLLADALLLAAQLSGDSSWLDAARLIADHVLKRTTEYGQPWRGAVGREYPPLGLSEGIAGIGHFLLRLSSDEIPSLLEPRTPTPGPGVSSYRPTT